MSSAADRVAAWVDAVLHGRRPPRFAADAEEAPALLAAAALRAAQPGEDLPSAEFVEALRQRLGAEVEAADRPAPRLRFTRRTLLEITGASAAAAVAGAVVSRALDHSDPTPPTSQATLTPDRSQWVTVIEAAAVGPGQAVRFTAGNVEGFVVNRGGRIEALSAVCTHMGCILKFNPTAGRLDCPCHGAAFALDGWPMHGYLNSLPRIEARVSGASVEVKVSNA